MGGRESLWKFDESGEAMPSWGMQHLVGASDRSATPADGICVGSIMVAWSQLDLSALPPGTAVAVLVPAGSSPQCATCAVVYCTDLPQPHQLEVLDTCI